MSPEYRLDHRTVWREIEHGAIAPAYLLVGSDDFLVDETVRRLRSELIDPRAADFSFRTFRAGEDDWAAVERFCLELALGGERRLAVVRGVERFLAPDREQMLAFLAAEHKRPVPARGELPTCCLVLVLDADRKNAALATQIGASARRIVFGAPQGPALTGQIQEIAALHRLTLTPDAIELLTELAGDALAVLRSEIEKLALRYGADQRVTEAMVRDSVSYSRSFQVYELSRAVGERDRGRALRILLTLKEWDEEPILLVASLARELFQLLIARTAQTERRTAELPALLGLKYPMVIRQISDRSRGWRRSELIAWLRALAEIDHQMKSRSGDRYRYLELLIARRL